MWSFSIWNTVLLVSISAVRSKCFRLNVAGRFYGNFIHLVIINIHVDPLVDRKRQKKFEHEDEEDRFLNEKRLIHF